MQRSAREPLRGLRGRCESGRPVLPEVRRPVHVFLLHALAATYQVQGRLDTAADPLAQALAEARRSGASFQPRELLLSRAPLRADREGAPAATAIASDVEEVPGLLALRAPERCVAGGPPPG